MSVPEKKSLQRSYQSTMDDMRYELPAHYAMLSKILHAPIVSRFINLLLATLFRPRPLLSGAVFALLASVASYAVMKLHGYASAELEPLLGFALGWLIGALHEIYLRLTNRHRHD